MAIRVIPHAVVKGLDDDDLASSTTRTMAALKDDGNLEGLWDGFGFKNLTIAHSVSNTQILKIAFSLPFFFSLSKSRNG
ncbi:hypothetical protein SLEP1_g35293 [Rubroshorea leprosula]|uniref:Uncharacterized protein n=1 Tax=Rubroshorea leprosula TaxID=152421 RepID=A0AAV5KMP4_9ROSI|nr:hypothetical protein SLEP1_g35293 [Rubroshorea leprosula]